MLDIKNLNQFYGQSHTLWDLSLHVNKGECLCVMGRNGVGKTTLMDTIMGQHPLASGSIILDGQDITKLPVEDHGRVGIGYVPQGRQIFPLLTVEENLKIGLPARRDGLKTIPKQVYDMFPVLYDMKHRQGGDLSGGQQQQLAIGRALVTDPKLIIFDEPTEGIQPNIVAEIASIVRRLNKEIGLTVLLVEQKLPFARKMGDRFFIIDRGHGVAEGLMVDLDETLIKKYLTV
ncbi:MAG: urea ABC transporter ATP-binding subunit UrtE [Succinivibrionaceae bacterium]|nr:urea ABC transporter ATP-binding subunit UrtE [Succinivibrionaceae bacterium]